MSGGDKNEHSFRADARKLCCLLCFQTRRSVHGLSCTLFLTEDSAGQAEGTHEQQGAPQGEVAAVGGVGAGGGPDEGGLDAVAGGDVPEGVTGHGAHALAVDLDVSDGVALVGCDGKGLVLAPMVLVLLPKPPPVLVGLKRQWAL